MTTVAIVEDQHEIREGLRALIGGTPGYQCTGAYRTMEAALAALPRLRPQVALVDIGLPGMSGIDGIEEMRRTVPEVAVIVLTVFEDDDRIFRAICAGASGYLLKKTPPAKMLQSIDEVVNGGAPMSPEVAHRVLELFRTFRPARRARQELNPHELRLLKLMVEGHNYQTAAAELSVTVHAISYHMRKIYQKLEVHSKSDAVAKALRNGLVR